MPRDDRREPPLPAFYDALDLTLEEAWTRLVRGAADRRSALHTPVLATIGLDGAPQLRTVVLRAADRKQASLFVHTDARSTKWAEIAARPEIALLFYDPAAKLQLRVAGTAIRHNADEITAAAWARTQPMSRICYQVTHPPGRRIETPEEAEFDAAATADGVANFAVLQLTINSIEVLHLAAAGHRRSRFERAGETYTGSWLVP